MATIPNLEEIIKIETNFEEEYNLESRLSRYESMSPELIELAKGEGIEDSAIAAHALFIADFVVTSSEVPAQLSDEDRRKVIIAVFKELLPYVDGPEKITKLFYIAYQLGSRIRRTNSFLGGRGINLEERAQILIDIFVLQFIKHSEKMVNDDGCRAELSLLSAALKLTNPMSELANLPEDLDISNPDFVKHLEKVMSEFMETHEVEVNDNVVLPNVEGTNLLYFSLATDTPFIAGMELKGEHTEGSINRLNELMGFLKSEGEAYKFLYLRGRIPSEGKNIILTKSPDRENLVLMRTEAEEVNVSELLSIMEAVSSKEQGWTDHPDLKPIGIPYTVTELVDVEKLVDKKVTEEIEVEEEIPEKEYSKMVEKYKKEELQKILDQRAAEKGEEANGTKEDTEEIPKKRGFFGRIKSIFGLGGGKEEKGIEELSQQLPDVVIDTSHIPTTRMVPKTVKKTIKEPVIEKVEKEVTKLRVFGNELPESVAKSIGILSLADLRLFETFDTIRESEYSITGSIFSDFQNDATSMIITEQLQDPDSILKWLDGLDDKIEKVVSHYFAEGIQVLPTEIIYVGPEDKKIIISMDGDEKKLVGTIAQTYQKDFSDWQKRSQSEDKLQRRSLHMRTGQLLSSLAHTPFDRSVERIYGLNEGDGAKRINLERSLLKLE